MKKRLTFKNLVIIAFFAMFIFSFIKQEITMRKIQEELTTAAQELQDVNDKNQQLQTELEEAKTQNEFYEKLVREKLGMVKPGESVVNSQKND